MGKVLFAGGGSLGHVTPSVAVATVLKKKSPQTECVFVCAPRSDETSVLIKTHFRFLTLSAPKFPRGFSPMWLVFPFHFLFSVIKSMRILSAEKPSVVFAKGGYVSVPVGIAAWVKKIPVVMHESDSVPSASGKLLEKIADSICHGFPFETDSRRHILTGNPVRPEILSGSVSAAQRITGFSGKRPVLMVIGGSQGALAINKAIDAQFEKLLGLCDIIHITGQGKAINRQHARYWNAPLVTDELPHLYAIADVVVTRAGAGVLSELAALKKTAIVIPLMGIAQEHQWKNAKALERLGGCVVLPQEKISELSDTVIKLLKEKGAYGNALHHALPLHATEKITDALMSRIDNR